MVRALYDKYRLDFQMFDYDIKDFIKFASESEGFLPDVIEIPEKKESEEAEEEVTDSLSTSDVTEGGETDSMQAWYIAGALIARVWISNLNITCGCDSWTKAYPYIKNLW